MSWILHGLSEKERSENKGLELLYKMGTLQIKVLRYFLDVVQSSFAFTFSQDARIRVVYMSQLRIPLWIRKFKKCWRCKYVNLRGFNQSDWTTYTNLANRLKTRKLIQIFWSYSSKEHTLNYKIPSKFIWKAACLSRLN